MNIACSSLWRLSISHTLVPPHPLHSNLEKSIFQDIVLTAKFEIKEPLENQGIALAQSPLAAVHIRVMTDPDRRLPFARKRISFHGGPLTMREAVHPIFNKNRVILFGFLTALLTLFQPTPTVSAQQLIGANTHETGGAVTQGRRIGNSDLSHLAPLKSLERKDVQTSTQKLHRLIRKPQNPLTASVESGSTEPNLLKPVPTPPPSPQSDSATAQPTEPSMSSRNFGAAVPLSTTSVMPSAATTMQPFAAGTASTGTIPLSAAAGGNSSKSGSPSRRSMSRLAAEIPELTQLISPPSTPVVSINPAIGASPTSLSFTAQQGSSTPTVQTLSISNTGGGTLSWTASDSAQWLTLSTTGGTGNSIITLTATTGTLTAGTYSGAITLTATGASSVTVPVIFTITAAPVPPAIGASPTSFTFTATQGSTNPGSQTLSISNTGSGTLSWTASDNVPWLTLTPASGTGNGSMTLSATTGTLAAGSHSGTVTLSGGTGVTPVTVPVTFTITAAPNITLNPSSLTYAATEGAANPANQTISLTTTGGTLSWTVSDNVSWLGVSPASGSNSNTLTASVNTTGLAAGTHTGTITVSAAGISSKTVAVTLTVNAPATSSADLTWNANTESDLAGYKVYRATASGAYGAPIATLTGNVTNYVATGLQVGTTYFFVVTAYDTEGNESSVSNEVSKSIF